VLAEALAKMAAEAAAQKAEEEAEHCYSCGDVGAVSPCVW
jgi:hypothetical protein